MSYRKPLLSIIVPVYNVDKYLCFCVDSILSQSFRDYELILVDDGSPDECPFICDKYAVADSRIKVIHKENGGLSDARNSGILAASGDYLLFIDSDDYIARDSLQKITDYMKIYGECDVVFLNAIGVLNDNTYREFAYTYDKNMIYKKSRNDVLSYFASISQFPVSACIKLIRRQFLIVNNLFFTKGIVCEDLDHMISLILCANSFDCYDIPYYQYRCFRENSISNSRKDKLFYDLLYIIKKWDELAKNKYSEYSTFIQKLLAYEYCPLLWYYHLITKSDQATYKNDMKKYAHLMSASKDKRVIATNIVYHLFGLRVISNLLNIYYVIKLNVKE